MIGFRKASSKTKWTTKTKTDEETLASAAEKGDTAALKEVLTKGVEGSN